MSPNPYARRAAAHQAMDADFYQNGCRAKKCYTSKKQANGRVRVMMQAVDYAGGRLRAYKCRVCHYWHVGNSSW